MWSKSVKITTKSDTFSTSNGNAFNLLLFTSITEPASTEQKKKNHCHWDQFGRRHWTVHNAHKHTDTLHRNTVITTNYWCIYLSISWCFASSLLPTRTQTLAMLIMMITLSRSRTMSNVNTRKSFVSAQSSLCGVYQYVYGIYFLVKYWNF